MAGAAFLWMDGVEEDGGITYDTGAYALLLLAIGLSVGAYALNRDRTRAAKGAGVVTAIVLTVMALAALAA